MRRTQQSQSVTFRGITGAGKSFTARLLTNQLLRLSSHSKKDARVAEQVKALDVVLNSFGAAKTFASPSASRHGRWTELHFNDRGRISGAQALTWGLDKSRLVRLQYEERTFHVFYQFLAGATPDERDRFNLEDPSEYALLASSGCYRLPGGPFSDDAAAMEELRGAFRTLGFKPKHVHAIQSVLVAVLLLGNLQFADPPALDEPARVANLPVLDAICHLLGVAPDDLAQALTTRTSYVKREAYNVFLDAERSRAQRERLAMDLYAILFAFVTELANHKTEPAAEQRFTQVVLLDQPGFQTRAASSSATLVQQHGQNGFDEFAIHFCDELVQAHVFARVFDEQAPEAAQMARDGISVPSVVTVDNAACVELLRGVRERGLVKPNGVVGAISRSSTAFRQGKSSSSSVGGGDELVQDLVGAFGTHSSFVTSPLLNQHDAKTPMFGINHYAGSCAYDARNFVERDADVLDPALVSLLRASGEPFIAKLFSGPGLAAESHPKDPTTVTQAQVVSRPIRAPLPFEGADGDENGYAELDPSKVYSVGTQLNTAVSELLGTLDATRMWTILCIRPNDSGAPNSFDKRRVRSQIRSHLLPDWVKRRSRGGDWSLRSTMDEFRARYGRTPGEYGWREGVEYAKGNDGVVWMSYGAWKSVEDALRAMEKDVKAGADVTPSEYDAGTDAQTHDYPMPDAPLSTEDLMRGVQPGGYGGGGLAVSSPALDGASWRSPSDFESKERLEPDRDEMDDMKVKEVQNTVEEVPTSRVRRWWVAFVWLNTWWIPSWCLSRVGRMKRPDVQMAWREKVTICILIFLSCAVVIFYIIFFGRLLCPNFDKGWSINEVNQHTGDDDFWVAVQGEVYDITNFWRSDHSDNRAMPVNQAMMKELAGQDLTVYFPIPLTRSCLDLVNNPLVTVQTSNLSDFLVPTALHTSGPLQGNSPTKLQDIDWYTKYFLPKMRNFHKGPLLVERKKVFQVATVDDGSARQWAILDGNIYDLTDYFYTMDLHQADKDYAYLNGNITDLWKQQPGQDVSKALRQVLEQNNISDLEFQKQMFCMRNNFYVGGVDFRKSARCQVQNYFLLVAAGIIMATILVKFLAALQLGGKRNPELQDKFIICQVPCYTEGEDSLRRTIDSLAALKYDDKRKLMFLICDGNIIGSGNDRPTPRIALDILGVDPSLDPEPLLFRSIGEGSKQLNYGKVYSGLYEFEGHVVPYVVVVKVGKPSERSRPGNRGKRDSQVLMMHYLNRVHFDAPMNPLELEIYHQMRNVIGIDPAFYEYIFMVDADTLVTPDSLNRMVACTSDDQSIVGICGETRLFNEEGSWWTMIQVYEYYISHHLAKAFESLFGSVTCLPGCFSMYRIRTADKGRPLIISNRVIDDYSECHVDTLHKKNLLSLGEDRYLTTIMMKHFPTFKMKFTPDALAHTVAPDRFSVLLSQRRRWINSTIHNLVELVFLPELCGFCLFSMRFVVFLDLLGTIILPATTVYLIYLIVTVSTGKAPIPIISLAMIAAVYGLQAIIFILKREFMLVGWMIIYILAYPIYSFFLPVYSFWCMDDFSWGNTRVVVGEGSNKKVVVADDEKFDESMIPLKKFSEYEAEAWETGSHHSHESRQSGRTSDTRSRSQDPYRKPRSQSRAQSHMSLNQASQSGDYYRDTNLTFNNSSNPNLRVPGSQSQRNTMMNPPQLQTNFGPGGFGSRPGSAMGNTPGSAGLLGMGLPAGSTTSLSMPFMSPFAGGPPSVHGSDYGGGMPSAGAFASPMSYGVPSIYGMPATAMNPFGARPLSTFSLATTVNPFAASAGGGTVAPSMNPTPSDDELVTALRSYLATQDLMSVTKKTTREALAARFPKADLTSRKDFINESIDRILSES
ncbi:glycosyltransferase family 2 protein [Exidia glandulosa HHB12029]|uniref:chitin synthase n=1 Tax=Exidia glandulosa HHB12029 TaxID=1314781 RepID=A0A165BJZ6_EXIGL|nr:glycosyltransferase family 2 protein [Exidia glandulosa HHB12029]